MPHDRAALPLRPVSPVRAYIQVLHTGDRVQSAVVFELGTRWFYDLLAPGCRVFRPGVGFKKRTGLFVIQG